MRVEHVGENVKERTVAALTQIRESADHRIVRERAEASDTVYLDVVRQAGGRLLARAVSGLPAGRTLEVTGWSLDDCLFEARHELLNLFWLDRMPSDTSADIRARVHRTHLSVISGDI